MKQDQPAEKTDELGEKYVYTQSDLDYHLYQQKQNLIREVEGMCVCSEGYTIRQLEDPSCQIHEVLSLLKGESR